MPQPQPAPTAPPPGTALLIAGFVLGTGAALWLLMFLDGYGILEGIATGTDHVIARTQSQIYTVYLLLVIAPGAVLFTSVLLLVFGRNRNWRRERWFRQAEQLDPRLAAPLRRLVPAVGVACLLIVLGAVALYWPDASRSRWSSHDDGFGDFDSPDDLDSLDDLDDLDNLESERTDDRFGLEGPGGETLDDL